MNFLSKVICQNCVQFKKVSVSRECAWIMDKEKQKRNRGSNFSKEEELLLLAEVEKYKNIIECKMTDKVNSSEKSETWQKIVASFNSRNACHRNLEQLKIKYDNLKNKARKIAAGNKNYIRGTGGGPSLGGDGDPAIEAVLRIINKKTVVGLENPFDCDRDDNNGMLINKNINDNNTNITVLRIEELAYDEQIPSSCTVPNVIEHLNYNEHIQNSAEQNSELVENIEVLETNDTQIQEIRTEEVRKKRKGNWSKYTPKKLRTPMSRKLRETVDNPFKEEYYKKKTELIEEEIKKNKLEQHHLTQKNLRDVEEHQKKMQLLELEIKLKQQLLKSNEINV